MVSYILNKAQVQLFVFRACLKIVKCTKKNKKRPPTFASSLFKSEKQSDSIYGLKKCVPIRQFVWSGCNCNYVLSAVNELVLYRMGISLLQFKGISIFFMFQVGFKRNQIP